MASAIGKCDGLIKLTVLGNQKVGKSSLLSQYVYGSYNHQYNTTRGGDIFKKIVDLRNGVKIEVKILDTAGDLGTLLTMLFRDAHGIMFVFDITNKKSFSDLEDWLRRVNQGAVKNPKIVLVGNKVDMAENYRKIKTREAEFKAKENGASYFEVSAKYNINVTDVFETLITEAWNQCVINGTVQHNSDNVKLGKSSGKHISCC